MAEIAKSDEKILPIRVTGLGKDEEGPAWKKFKDKYRDRLKGLYVVARNFFLLLLNFSAWPCLAVA